MFPFFKFLFSLLDVDGEARMAIVALERVYPFRIRVSKHHVAPLETVERADTANRTVLLDQLKWRVSSNYQFTEPSNKETASCSSLISVRRIPPDRVLENVEKVPCGGIV